MRCMSENVSPRCLLPVPAPDDVYSPRAKKNIREEAMDFRISFGLAVPTAALLPALSVATSASAFDESRYPNFSGLWRKPVGIGNQCDQTKPLGRAQEPPFTPEYQAIFEASLSDQTADGLGNYAPSHSVLITMPLVM